MCTDRGQIHFFDLAKIKGRKVRTFASDSDTQTANYQKKKAPKKVLQSSSIKDRSRDTEGKKIRETRESVKEKERRGDW